ncbi:carboxylesterase family protein [Nonomuraea rubra]|uniref:carboxylesterase family protein n=1 Tax=Nonomuraea rubra TaxID=46180 RepID=UPI00361570F5
MALLLVQGCGAAKARAEPSTVPGLEVALDSGMIRGVEDGDVLRYRGIRYARPPVGELRWRPPQPVARWRGSCPQQRPAPPARRTTSIRKSAATSKTA